MQCPLLGAKRTLLLTLPEPAWRSAFNPKRPSSNPDFSASDGARSCKEWMRRSLLAFPLHHVDAGADFGVGLFRPNSSRSTDLNSASSLKCRLSASPVACRTVTRAWNMVIRVLLGPGRAAMMLL